MLKYNCVNSKKLNMHSFFLCMERNKKLKKFNLTDFQKRKFSNCFIAVYVVTKDIKIRTDICLTNKKMYIVFGLDIMESRQILGIYFDNENEDYALQNIKENDIVFVYGALEDTSVIVNKMLLFSNI